MKKRISDYLDSRCILFLDVDSREKVIDSLLECLDQSGKLPEKEMFRRAIFDRENLVSTGIGMGIAIPHAKLEGISEFFVAIGIQRMQGIEWNALDKLPVRLIFLIGGPDNRQTEYLKILSLLTSCVREPEMRRKLLQASSCEEVIKLVSTAN